jgi:hypothetical protein
MVEGRVREVIEEELASLLSTLEEGLIQAGLSSLVNQERIAASEGRAEELTTGDVVQLRLEWSRQRRGTTFHAKAGDVRVRSLGTAERLAELLDLVEVAVGGTYAIEVRLRDDLKAALDGDERAWDGQVVFADPPESELVGTSQQEWILPDQSALQQRAPAVREVILLINQLRDQAELSRSERLRSVASSDDGNNDFAIPGDWS